MAILEDDKLAELLIDRPEILRTVGNIYLGQVEAVLPGMQAAFVDIGQEKSAFLHASDLVEPDDDDFDDDDDDNNRPPPKQSKGRRPNSGPGRGRSRRPEPIISDLLQRGQELLVQVTKEPISTKGSRVTGQVSIPGHSHRF